MGYITGTSKNIIHIEKISIFYIFIIANTPFAKQIGGTSYTQVIIPNSFFTRESVVY